MLKRFQNFVNHDLPHLQQGKSLLAISGGADSVAMGELFHRAGFPFEVAHLNYGLRGAESDADEAFVKEQCQKWGVKLHISRPQTLDFAEQNKLSVQMAARKLRYDFFEQVRHQFDCTAICTAHQRTDNLEHFFIFLLRNSPAAWLGIPEKNNHLYRPMLFASAEEIRLWLKSIGQEWRDDSSNNTLNYLRNRVRHLILPHLQDVFPEAENEYYEISREGRTGAENTKKNLAEWAKTAAQDNNGSLFFPTGTSAQKLTQYLVLRGMNRSMATHFLQQHEPGKRFYFNGQCAEVVHGGHRLKKAETPHFDTRVVLEAPAVIMFGQWQIQLSILPQSGLNFKQKNAFYFDADALQWPICFRSFIKGDRFVPFGMTGSKKVSDLLTDLHVPASDKPGCPVVECGNGVLAVLPHRRSAALPISDKTKLVMCVEWKSLQSL